MTDEEIKRMAEKASEDYWKETKTKGLLPDDFEQIFKTIYKAGYIEGAVNLNDFQTFEKIRKGEWKH